MKVGFVDILLFVLFFQLLSLLPFLIFQKSNNGISNKILGIFLFSKAICITNLLGLHLYDYVFIHFPHCIFFGSSFTILWGPTLYFYIKSLTNVNFRYRKLDLIHFQFFLCHFLYLTFTFHIYNADTKRELLKSGSLFFPHFWNFYLAYLHTSILLYTLASLHVIRKYRSEIKNSYSTISSINLSWMYFVLFGFIAKWAFDVAYNFTEDNSIFIISRVLLFVFLNAMIYMGLRQPVIFMGIANEMHKKYSLSKSLREKYLNQLLVYMEKEEPYLNPDLTLLELAEKVYIPPRSLSEVINISLNQNFYDFVNSYRIRASKRLLSDSKSGFKTVLEVLFEVGFNSKSSFNTAFKRSTGMTPTQFKKSQIV